MHINIHHSTTTLHNPDSHLRARQNPDQRCAALDRDASRLQHRQISAITTSTRLVVVMVVLVGVLVVVGVLVGVLKVVVVVVVRC
jgi:hypothetical protein